jgi:protein TonB
MRFAFVLLVFGLGITTGAAAVHALQATPPQQSAAATTGPAVRPPTVSVKEAKEHFLTHPHATYSPIAKAAHVTGVVTLGVEIGLDGHVTQVVVLSGPEMLRAASADAVRKWVFKPFLQNGAPIVVLTAVQFSFRNVYATLSDE